MATIFDGLSRAEKGKAKKIIDDLTKTQGLLKHYCETDKGHLPEIGALSRSLETRLDEFDDVDRMSQAEFQKLQKLQEKTYGFINDSKLNFSFDQGKLKVSSGDAADMAGQALPDFASALTKLKNLDFSNPQDLIEVIGKQTEGSTLGKIIKVFLAVGVGLPVFSAASIETFSSVMAAVAGGVGAIPVIGWVAMAVLAIGILWYAKNKFSGSGTPATEEASGAVKDAIDQALDVDEEEEYDYQSEPESEPKPRSRDRKPLYHPEVTPARDSRRYRDDRDPYDDRSDPYSGTRERYRDDRDVYHRDDLEDYRGRDRDRDREAPLRDDRERKRDDREPRARDDRDRERDRDRDRRPPRDDRERKRDDREPRARDDRDRERDRDRDRRPPRDERERKRDDREPRARDDRDRERDRDRDRRPPRDERDRGDSDRSRHSRRRDHD